MKYEIITEQNFSDIEKLMQTTKEKAEQSYKLDKFRDYCVTNIAILGREAIEKFYATYAPEQTSRFNEPPKTDGKLSAKLIPFIIGDYYCYLQNNLSGFAEFRKFDGISYLVEVCGTLLRPYKYGNNDKVCRFLLFNPEIERYENLPYDYDKENPTPNGVGTFSDKKLLAWRDYLLKKQETEKSIRDAKGAGARKFLAAINALDKDDFQSFEVDDREGEICKNGLKYTYTIDEYGNVRTKLELCCDAYYADDKLSTFLQMCKGSFVPKHTY